MATAKEGCGTGQVATGNGRRLHLGIPEAVFVVRDTPFPGVLTRGRRLFFFPGPILAWTFGEGAELKVKGGSGQLSPRRDGLSPRRSSERNAAQKSLEETVAGRRVEAGAGRF
ncbi:Prefoldin subunit 3 [Tupaia chinensis]|uniref:Prefoldin subunit 3 n=1 Tax=Tupaia chinensis TaxID=246437 RepID=L8Y0A9_TUPCH|nr:Prefoldin subunit 3 [Tupaia chinensis]